MRHFLCRISEQIFQKALDKSEQLFYNKIKQMCRTNVQIEREIAMNTSTARKIISQPKNIVLTVYKKQEGLFAQRLAGAAMLLLIFVSVTAGTEFAGLLLIAPMAAAAVFSKEKLMDFRIFGGTSRQCRPRSQRSPHSGRSQSRRCPRQEFFREKGRI